MTVICGLKTNHDGTVAVIADGELVFSYETEKTANNARHAPLDDVDIGAALAEHGIGFGDVDVFAIDGWAGGRVVAPTDRLTGTDGWLTVAPYAEAAAGDPVLAERRAKVVFDGRPIEYLSFTHAAGHVAGSYCASPFAARGEDALVLAWDGGMSPRLYLTHHDTAGIDALGPLFELVGNGYPVLAAHLDPFRRPAVELAREDIGDAELELPGKAMAYAGLGEVDPDLFPGIAEIIPDRAGPATRYSSFRYARALVELSAGRGLDSASLIATYQAYLAERLVAGLTSVLAGLGTPSPNLVFTGGCALNIGWNSALRASGLFAQVWVPPFPNDAGSALGTAAAAAMALERRAVLRWDVYRGQPLRPGRLEPSWVGRPCSPDRLAALLHDTGEPVVVLAGRAELGPRALGNRSILCPPTDAAAKDRLNRMKGREWYRPVAPVCLEDRAPDVFDPGTPDPYMLFTHRVRPNWQARIPAVVHVDGTARLQTVSAAQNPVLAEVLAGYERRSGIPVLCNTSANLRGRGFFPDLATAMRWGQASYLWSDGTLYENPALRFGAEG